MITAVEEQYLKTIPEDLIVDIKPFESSIRDIADHLISQIHKSMPELKVEFMGASGLGISGQGDLDIYALSSSVKFFNYLKKLKNIFGEPEYEHEKSVEWSFVRKGHDVDFYLTDPDTEEMRRQIKVFKLLKNDEELLKEYEQIKESMNGKSMRDYQRMKYEFYNRILTKDK